MVAAPSRDGNISGSGGRDCIITENVIAFAFSERGRRHISGGTPCQDAGAVSAVGGGVFICAADGHGGEDYMRSQVGSMLCCRAARECMTDGTLLAALDRAASSVCAERLIAQLKKSVICRWNELVAEHLSENPLTEEELGSLPERTAEHYRAGEYLERAYGTTLLAALTTRSYCLILQLGDGKCVVLRDGEYISPMPDDERCIGNQTTSMCDSRAFAETRHCFFAPLGDIERERETSPPGGTATEEEPGGADIIPEGETGRLYGYVPEAVFLCTDGISNSFSDDEGLYNFYYMVTENLCETYDGLAKEKCASLTEEDMRAEMDELREFISIISQKGSGDDVSLAAVINVK